MWLVFPALAEGPAHPDPMDLDVWEARARALEAGPAGCWELTGEVVQKATGFLPMTRWSRPERVDSVYRGPVDARVDGGTWTRFDVALVADGPEGEDLSVPVSPLVGKLSPEARASQDAARAAARAAAAGDGAGDPDDEGLTLRFGTGGENRQAANLIRSVLDALRPETATSYAEWRGDPPAIVLVEDVPTERHGKDVVTLRTTIPDGGAHATALDVAFPARVRAGEGLVKVTLFDAQGHVRAQVVGDAVLPALESLSFGVGALGFTVGYEQTITWRTATPCTSAAPAP